MGCILILLKEIEIRNEKGEIKNAPMALSLHSFGATKAMDASSGAIKDNLMQAGRRGITANPPLVQVELILVT
jgi:hypothetical protein